MENSNNTNESHATRGDIADLKLDTKYIRAAIGLMHTALIDKVEARTIAEELNELIEEYILDAIDYSSAEFEIDYDNRINLINIDFNTSDLSNEITRLLEEEYTNRTITKS